MGDSLEWCAFNIVKYHNISYHHTILTQGLLKQSLKQCLQFEINHMELFSLNDSNNSHLGFDFNHVHHATMATFLVLGGLITNWHIHYDVL
jgi:hypothetical protein